MAAITTNDPALDAEVNAIFCCRTQGLKRALMSGLVGTLQKEGWSEENRAKIAHAYHKSCYLHERGIVRLIPPTVPTHALIVSIRYGPPRQMVWIASSA